MIRNYDSLIHKLVGRIPLGGGMKTTGISRVNEADQLRRNYGFPGTVRDEGDSIKMSIPTGGGFAAEGRELYFRSANTIANNSAFTAANAHLTRLEPAGYLLLREVSTFTNEQIFGLSEARLLFYLLSMVELMNGIDFLDSPQLELQLANLHKVGVPGALSSDAIHLYLGCGYYAGDTDAYEQAILTLPLAEEIKPLLAELLRRFPGAKSVADFSVKNLRETHRSEMKIFLRKHAPAYEGIAVSLKQLFYKVGKIQLNIAASVVGVLRGQPLSGNRGESAYLCASHGELLNAYQLITDRIRKNAELPERHSLWIPTSAVFGTSGIDFAEFIDRTRAHIETATTVNELLACFVRLLRLLGLRNSLTHRNPILYIETEPLVCLRFADKEVAGKRLPRFVPITDAIARLIECIGDYCGENLELPYLDGEGNACVYVDLTSQEKWRLHRILRDEELYNSGRTAWHNFLRKHGFGEVPRQLLVGHGSSEHHVHGFQTVVGKKDILCACAAKLLPLFESEGGDALAMQLREKFMQIATATPATGVVKSPELIAEIEANNHPGENDEAPPPELTPVERCLKSQIASLLATTSAREPESIKIFATPVSLAVLLSIELKIPTENITIFQPYYRYDSLVIDEANGLIYFLAVGQHEDAGGLFLYPIYVCTREEAGTNLVCRHFRAAWERFHRRQNGRGVTKIGTQLTSPLFPDGSLTPQKLGAALKHFLHPPGGRSDLKVMPAYHLLKRISFSMAQDSHPGMVVGALSGRSLSGLNHFSIEDVIRFGRPHDPKLMTVAGTPYTNPMSITDEDRKGNTRLLDDLGRDESMPPKTPRLFRHGKPNSAWGYKKLKELFRAYNVVPSVNLFFRVIKRLTGDGRKAYAVSLRIFRTYRREGWLKVAEPLPLLTGSEYEDLLEKMGDYICTQIRPRHACSGDLEVSREGLKAEHALLVWALANALCRLGEAAQTRGSDVTALASNVWILNREGKTDAASRPIDLALVSPLPAGSDQVVRLLAALPRTWVFDTITLFPNLAAKYPGPVNSDGFKRMVRRDHDLAPINTSTLSLYYSRWLAQVGGRADVSTHDLRHIGIILRIARALSEIFITGNFSSFLCSLCLSVGHGSLLVTLYTYVGTAVAALQILMEPYRRAFAEQQNCVPDSDARRMAYAKWKLVCGSQRRAESILMGRSAFGDHSRIF